MTPAPAIPCRPARPRTGVSLLELVLALAIIAVVAGGLGAAVAISARAVPEPGAATDRVVETARVADRMAGELVYAISVTESTPTAVSFTVDRGGATVAIRYAWSGAAGDPLVRSKDGGPAVTVLEGVQTLDLDYLTETVVGQDAPPVVEGPEELLLQQDETTTNGSGSGVFISSNVRLAQGFQPAFPADVVSWRVTRCKFIASPKNPANGELLVSVKTASGNGKPSGSDVDAVVVPESNFSSNQWYEVVFPTAGGLAPGDEHFIAFARASGGGTVAALKTDVGSTNSPDTHYWWDGGGGGWAEDTSRDLRLWVWGRPSTADPSWVPPASGSIHAVDITLNTTTDPAAASRTTTRLLNEPDAP